MTKDVRIVAPFLPLPPENGHHLAIGDFDWMDAIRMLAQTVKQSCHTDLEVLTDVSADLPFQALKYYTTRRRLMLWWLEIAACYLESEAFDRDTIALDSDQLVFGDLRRLRQPYVDLQIPVRRQPKGKKSALPILNGVQFWPLNGKPKLGPFYRRALALAETLSEDDIKWGADTIALWRLLEPLDEGLKMRAGLRVYLMRSENIIEALSTDQVNELRRGALRQPTRPVLDFRNTRKVHMRSAFDALVPPERAA